MNKLFWLTSTAMVCCCVVMAQQQPDESTSYPSQEIIPGKDAQPIDFSYSLKEQNKVRLYWKTDSVQNGDFFIVEKSTDGSHFETMGLLKGLANITDYEITDNAPLTGNNFYRVRQLRGPDSVNLSKVLKIDLFHPDFKFYPNPVDKLLIIQSDHVTDIQIISTTGAVLISRQIQAGLQVINVASLEKGSYLLRVTDKISNKDVTEHLLKN